MKILALSTNYKYHQDVLESLLAKGITTEFATSHRPNIEARDCDFYKNHNTKLINGKAFYRLKEMQKLITAETPALTREMLEHFEAIERDYYILTDRYSYFPKPFRYRKRLFRHGLRFWFEFFAKNKIDGIFSICTPHNLPDYLAYHVAKYLGIKILFTNNFMVNDHVMILDDYRTQIKVPSDYMYGQGAEEIKATFRETVRQKCNAACYEITATQKKNDKALGLKNTNIKADEVPFAKKFARFKFRARKYISPQIFEPKFKANFAMDGELNDFTRRFIRIACGRRIKALRNDYNEMSVPADLSKKFVYFAMHLQPERTTQPEADVFEDHFMAIELLSQSVPSDWLVYVKENPAQYGKKLSLVQGKHFRDKSDYNDILRLPNVKLISQNVKTNDLIENAQVVSTIKGSVGWESLNAGKGVLIFGNAWYSPCDSAVIAHDIASCKAAIAKITSKTKEEVALDKLKFISYMQPHVVIGSMGGQASLDLASEPYENLVNELAEGLAQRFKAA